MHLLRPEIYRPIMPAWLPAHGTMILISGIAECLGGAGLLVSRTRRPASLALIVLLIAVFPANVEMLRVYHLRGVPRWAEVLLWIRLPVQLLLIWWVWKAGRGAASCGRQPTASAT